MSLLSAEQQDAIFYTLEAAKLSGSVSWLPEEFKFIFESGWQDYMSSFNNLDVFPGTYWKTLVVRDGKLYVRFTDLDGPLASTFKARYYIQSSEGMVPIALAPARNKLGYDYLLPVDVLLEDAFSYFNRTKRLPTTLEAQQMVNLTKYGVYLDLYIVTDLQGNQRLAAFPRSQYGKGERILNAMLTQAMRGYYFKGEVTPESLTKPLGEPQRSKTNQLAHDYAEDYDARWTEPDFYVKPRQYTLPSASVEDLIVAENYFHLAMQDTRSIRHDLYTEIIMALASKGLLSRMEGRNVYDYYAEHIQSIGGYMRHPLALFGDAWGSSPETYQSKYSAADMVSNYLDPIRLNYSRDTYLPKPTRIEYIRPGNIKNRLKKLYLDRAVMLADIIPKSEVDDVTLSGTLRGRVASFVTKDGYTHELSSIFISSQLISVINSLRALDKDQSPHTLEQATYTNPYITIHGVIFRSEDLVKVLHNTPLTGPISLGIDKYDPMWLSYKDIKLLRDLLNGRIMTYVYVNSLSDQAFLTMSGQDTFIHLYHSRNVSRWVDRAFSIGAPLVDQLATLKSSSPQGAPGGLVTLLSLF